MFTALDNWSYNKLYMAGVDKDSEMEPGPVSIKSYLKYMLWDCVWGDFIVLNLISALWGGRIHVW